MTAVTVKERVLATRIRAVRAYAKSPVNLMGSAVALSLRVLVLHVTTAIHRPLATNVMPLEVALGRPMLVNQLNAT